MLFGSGEGVSRLQRCHFLRWKPWLLNSLRLFCRTSAFPRPPRPLAKRLPPPRISRTSTPIVPKGQWPTPELASSRPHHGASNCALHLGTSIFSTPRRVSGATRRAGHPGLPQPSLSTHCLHPCPPRTGSRSGASIADCPPGSGAARSGERGPSSRTLTSGGPARPQPPGCHGEVGAGWAAGQGGAPAVRCLATRGTMAQAGPPLPSVGLAPRAQGPARRGGAGPAGRLGYRPGRWAAARDVAEGLQ